MNVWIDRQLRQIKLCFYSDTLRNINSLFFIKTPAAWQLLFFCLRFIHTNQSYIHLTAFSPDNSWPDN